MTMRNSTRDRFDGLYHTHKGYISTKELRDAGFSNRQITALAKDSLLEKICHGYYWMTQCGCEKPADYKCIEVCLSNPRAVVAMESACYYQGMTDTEPDCLTIATERTDRSIVKMNFPVERHYFSGSIFQEGIRKVESAFGSYHIYDPERSLCDIIRLKRGTADRMIAEEIFDRIKAEKEQYTRVLKYAEMLRIDHLIPESR